MTFDPGLQRVVGVSLAVLSAFAYAATNVLIRRGTRSGLDDHGLMLTLAVNLMILVPVTLVVGPDLDGPAPVDGIMWYAVSGLLAGFLGRLALFGGIARIGSSRTSSLKNAAPMVAVVAGIVMLGERLNLQSWLGIALCLSGLGLLIRNRQPVLPASRPTAATAPGPDDGDGAHALDPALVVVAPAASRPSPDRSSVRVAGVVYGLGAAVFFGLSQVSRKAAMTDLPDALLGGLVAVAVSALGYVAYLGSQRRVGEIVRASIRHANLSLVGAGVTSTVGMLSFLLALTVLPVSVASVIAGSEAMFTVALAAVVLRRHEMVTKQLAFAALLVCLGAVVLSSS